MKTFEYSVALLKNDNLIKELNELGIKGWQVVDMDLRPKGDVSHALLMREKEAVGV